MRNDTRLAFNAYVQAIAQLNGVPDATKKFAVAPTVQQKLESRMMESTAFLGSISIIGVNELMGQKVGIGVTGPIASRTDTSGASSRTPRDVKDLSSQDYLAKQTNYDTKIRYATLDAWAKFPDFQTRLRDAIIRQQGLDRIMIGFNGTSAAATTDLVANPLLQDVNIGWLQHIRNESAERVIDHGAVAGHLTVGATGDYKNLDALVYEAVHSLLQPWYRNHPDLRVIIGSELNVDNVLPQLENETAPTEREALARLLAQSKIGGIPSMQAPFMKAGSILITLPKNLAIYYQEGGRRRTIVDNAAKDQIENYESSNDAYVVEDFGAACLLENIEFV